MKLPVLSLRLKVVRNVQKLSHPARHLLLYMVCYINASTGQISEKLKYITVNLRLSRRAIEYAFAELRDTGWIETQRCPNRAAIHTILPANFLKSLARKAPVEISKEISPEVHYMHFGGAPGALPRYPGIDIHTKTGSNPLPVVKSKSGEKLSHRADDLWKISLFDALRKKFPAVEDRTFEWALAVVVARGGKPRDKHRYYFTAVSELLKDVARESRKYLGTAAVNVLARSKQISYADLSEDLKCLAARCGIPYNQDVISETIKRAAGALGLNGRNH